MIASAYCLNSWADVRYFPAGQIIHVTRVYRDQGGGGLWYEVELAGYSGLRVWINSTALIKSGGVLLAN